MTTQRKVRKDFDTTAEYSVDVSWCTEEEKKEVQQAFFDVGILWQFGEARFTCLDALQYSNTTDAGCITTILMYGTPTHKSNMTANEFLELVYEPEQQGYVHAELMAQYGEDAKTHEEPWKLWEFKGGGGIWWECPRHPTWDTDLEYRRKPKTHFVHGVEIPDLRITPKYGDMYWCPMPHLEWQVAPFESWDCSTQAYKEEHNLCYEYTEEGKQAAILHAKAMLGIEL